MLLIYLLFIIHSLIILLYIYCRMFNFVQLIYNMFLLYLDNVHALVGD